jgi:SAM-dependent methyltransferase
MTPEIQAWVKQARQDFIKTPGRVLEIGSLDINGGVRQFFPDAREYVGIDLREGPGVDLVMDAHEITRREMGTFDTILCLETLEHDSQFWVTVENVKSVLGEGGHLIVSTPTFGFPLHRYPKDYWRFGEDAFREYIFSELKILRLSYLQDARDGSSICCIGVGY